MNIDISTIPWYTYIEFYCLCAVASCVAFLILFRIMAVTKDYKMKERKNDDEKGW